MANGIVLPKPGKPDYSSPASFRIIVLLQTISKILERIVATRLSLIARSRGLINTNQCGSLSGLSTFDACASLTHEVRSLQRPGIKASTLFLDIKGGFDNISSSFLSQILLKHEVPRYLVSWVRSFLSDRQCKLLFQGAPGVYCPVQVGAPQGSPVSPLLFLIYVSCLHISIPRSVIFSYVDDFSVTVSSASYRGNIRALQRIFSLLSNRAARIGVSFSIPKTELIHWRTEKDRSPVSHSPVALRGTLFYPSRVVRWLGYWFTPSLETTTHFLRRLNLAQAAFSTVRQLSPSGAGMPPYACHRLASGLILPILSYGADLFQPTVATSDKMSVFWNKVLRWITNCFRATPTTILACEACLPPLPAIFKHKRKMAALRLACSSPQINPAAARLPPTLPIADSSDIRASTRRVLLGRRTNCIPLPWDRYKASAPTRRHLPIDALCHLLLPILQFAVSFPLAAPHLLPDLLPEEHPYVRAYGEIKSKLRTQLLQDWALQSPPPLYYKHLPSLRPHAFMGLDKFTAGRIHQMRAGKSYLAAHTTWEDPEASTICPHCEEEDETLSHAILHCPAKADIRLLCLPGVDDIGPASPLWSSAELTTSLAKYVTRTGTGFPPSMPAFRGPPPSPG
jgi:hypothetical protein